MKKTLLSLFAVTALIGQVKAQNFTSDNIVTLKLSSLASYGRVATVSMEEYATSGGAVVSATNISNTGSGNDFYLPYGSASNQSTAYLNLSTDNQLLTLYGYNTLPSETGNVELSAVGALDRTFVAINSSKGITKIVTDAHSAANVNRSALAYPLGEGTYGVYLAGHGAGIKHSIYTPSLTSPILSTGVSVNSLNTIDVKIYNGKLYATSQVTAGVSSFDTDLPTTSAAISGTFAVSNAQDFVIFNMGTNKVMYVAVAANTATSADGIFKYYSTNDGETWTAAGKVNGNTTTAADNGVRGLSGRIEAGKITLYGVTSNNSQNSLLRVVDNVAYNVAVTNANATITNLATAPAGSGFRGVAFTPGSTVTLPVTLSKNLSGKVTGTGVSLNWETATEKDSKEFQLLHSVNGKDFEIIGTRSTNSPNGANYSFTHFNATSGINYYQLKQIDNNGKSKTFDPIAIDVKFPVSALSVICKPEEVVAVLNVSKAAHDVSFSIVDMNGKVFTKTSAHLIGGINQIQIPAVLNNGIYVLRVAGEKITENVKFLKN